MARVKNQQGSESRGPGSKHTALKAHRKQELSLALGWVAAPLSTAESSRLQKKMSFHVSRMSVQGCPQRCIMGFVPEKKHWTHPDAGRARCRETEHQCRTIISLAARRQTKWKLVWKSFESIINFTSTLFKHQVSLFKQNLDFYKIVIDRWWAKPLRKSHKILKMHKLFCFQYILIARELIHKTLSDITKK